MRWLGQAQRAFDLLCERMHERETFGTPLQKNNYCKNLYSIVLVRYKPRGI